jgi:hypothetical protein
MVGRSLRSLALVAAVLSPPTAALADSVYFAGISGVSPVSNSPTPVTLTTSIDDTTGGHLEGIASAAPAPGAKLESSAPARGFATGNSTGGSADLSARFDDIVVRGPGSDPVPFKLTIPFHAVFFQDWSFLDFDGGGSDVSHVDQRADIEVDLAGLFGAGDVGRIIVDVDDWSETADVSLSGAGNTIAEPQASPSNPLDTDGYLNLLYRIEVPIGTASGVTPVGAGFAVHDAVQLRGAFVLSGMVPVGAPLTLQFRLSLASRAFGGFGLDASGTASALNVLYLSRGARVFELPEGYTANSPSLGLVENFVPEPSEPALWAGAVAALASVGRRRLQPAPRRDVA